MRATWRWRRVLGPKYQRPKFFHLRTRRRNPLDDRVLRVGPIKVTW